MTLALERFGLELDANSLDGFDYIRSPLLSDNQSYLFDRQYYNDIIKAMEYSIQELGGYRLPDSEYISKVFFPRDSNDVNFLIDLPSVYDAVKNKLRQFEMLSDGWDGEGSKAPLESTLNMARRILSIIVSKDFEPPHAMLSGDGEISLFWKSENYYAEIIVCEEDGFSFLFDPKGGQPVGFDNIPLKDLYGSVLVKYIA